MVGTELRTDLLEFHAHRETAAGPVEDFQEEIGLLVWDLNLG